MRISDWSSDVCSSDLPERRARDVGKTEVPDEGRRYREGQEKFDAVDGAHDLARLGALDEQVRGDHRPPAAAARRVEEPPDQAEGGDECRLADLGGKIGRAHV